jgi:transcription initiation factor IIE alpha subunit
MILKGKDALYLKSELKEELFMCPKCREKVSMKSLVSEDGVKCPECSRVATITIIDNTGFVSWTCGIK